jgi:hypothetical protein
MVFWNRKISSGNRGQNRTGIETGIGIRNTSMPGLITIIKSMASRKYVTTTSVLGQRKKSLELLLATMTTFPHLKDQMGWTDGGQSVPFGETSHERHE